MIQGYNKIYGFPDYVPGENTTLIYQNGVLRISTKPIETFI
jgi:hypothetical protein